VHIKRIGIVICMLFVMSCGLFGGSKNLHIGDWNSYQKANFFMTTWMSEKSAYDAMNALENKPDNLIKVLEAKQKVLEGSRIPIRTYVTLVNQGGIPDAGVEQQIIDWLRQLQLEYVYSN